MYLIFLFISLEYINFQKFIVFIYVTMMFISCFIWLSYVIQLLYILYFKWVNQPDLLFHHLDLI